MVVAVILPYDARLFEKDFVLPPSTPGDTTAVHPGSGVLRDTDGAIDRQMAQAAPSSEF